jgi:pilus assembly protein Flp/PilA
MKRYLDPVIHFMMNEDGPTAVEYAVMLSFIIIVCVVVIRQLGTSTSATFSLTNSMMTP